MIRDAIDIFTLMSYAMHYALLPLSMICFSSMRCRYAVIDTPEAHARYYYYVIS